jgi:thiol-disulfide isomerase/thioredoxin
VTHSILLTRAVWALGIIATGLVLYWLINRVVLFRAQKSYHTHLMESLSKLNGTPAILYFTTPDCVACKVAQRPALQRLQERLGGRLQVIEVDAQARPDLASRWGVLSVPTTFIIDPQGQLRHVNHGVARTEKLLQQLHGII